MKIWKAFPSTQKMSTISKVQIRSFIYVTNNSLSMIIWIIIQHLNCPQCHYQWTKCVKCKKRNLSVWYIISVHYLHIGYQILGMKQTTQLKSQIPFQCLYPLPIEILPFPTFAYNTISIIYFSGIAYIEISKN